MSFTFLAYKFVAAQKHLLCQLLLVFLIQTPDHVTSAKRSCLSYLNNVLFLTNETTLSLIT